MTGNLPCSCRVAGVVQAKVMASCDLEGEIVTVGRSRLRVALHLAAVIETRRPQVAPKYRPELAGAISMNWATNLSL